MLHEINLLPPPRRRSLQREVTLRLLLRVLTTLLQSTIALGTIGLIILIGLMSVSWRLTATSQTQVAAVVADYQKLRDKIAENNILLQYVQGLSENRHEWSVLLADLMRIVPSGVEVSSLSGTSTVRDNTMNDVTLNIHGQALSRGTLIIFANRLSGLKGVTAIDAPNSNLIRRDNPLYRFTLHLTPPAQR